jgi:hypothetical protein
MNISARVLEYSARVSGSASEPQLKELLLATDQLAEIQNTLRRGADVRLGALEVRRVEPSGRAGG